MKYIAYIRVSTDDQKVGRDAQIKSCQDYCKKLGIILSGTFTDEGLSGNLPFDKRPGIFEAINSLEKGSVLLVAKRDRLSRGDAMAMAMIEAAVARKKSKIISVAGEGTDNDDPSSMLMRRMVDAFGEYERLIIKSRTKNALQLKKSRNERVGYIPFGKKLNEDGIHLEDCEEELAIIEEIHFLRETGLTYKNIADEMNSEGFFNRDGRKWSHLTVFNLLKK